MKNIAALFVLVLIIFSISNSYSQKNETFPMEFDKLWKLATTSDKLNLTDFEKVKLRVYTMKDPNYLDNIADASKTCDALKHYDKLDKNMDCKEWFLTEWEYWKALNK